MVKKSNTDKVTVSHISGEKCCNCQASISEIFLFAFMPKHNMNHKASHQKKPANLAHPDAIGFVGSGCADMTSIRCLAGCLLTPRLSRPVRATPSSGPAKASQTHTHCPSLAWIRGLLLAHIRGSLLSLSHEEAAAALPRPETSPENSPSQEFWIVEHKPSNPALCGASSS